MDVIFNCPKCDQELAVDSSGAGTQIDCPSCGEAIVIPAAPANRVAGKSDAIPAAGPLPSNPMASSAAARVELHLKVPQHKAAAALIEKPLPPLDATAKDTDKKLRVKTIKHTDCVEVGHDRFDEVVSSFLAKTGEANIVSITALSYSHLDIGTQKLLNDFGVLIVYRG
jgi:ribosomal protein S27E